MTIDNNQAAILGGAGAGVYKGLTIMLTAVYVSWDSIIQTIILAGIGAAVGWAVSEFLSFIKKKFYSKNK